MEAKPLARSVRTRRTPPGKNVASVNVKVSPASGRDWLRMWATRSVKRSSVSKKASTINYSEEDTMKHRRWLLQLAVMALSAAAWGQNQPVTGSITTSTAGAGNCVSTRAQNNSVVGIDVSGTFTGLTLQPTVQVAAVARNKKVQALDGTLQSTITAVGSYKATISGFTVFQVCASALSTGSATVSLFATPAGDNTLLGITGKWATTTVAGNAGALPSSAANKALMWGIMLPDLLNATSVRYFCTNADNTATYNYDLGLYNSAGTLVVNISAGSLHGSTFCASAGAQTANWVQGTTALPAGPYYVAYYTSNTTATPPSLQSTNGNGVSFYIAQSNSATTSTQGSGGFSITPQTGGILPVSITAPADSAGWACYMPALILE
jgi:hypothetical protein